MGRDRRRAPQRSRSELPHAIISPPRCATASRRRDRSAIALVESGLFHHAHGRHRTFPPTTLRAMHPFAFIAIGDSDPWRVEQDLYAEKLQRAGVKLEVFRVATSHLGPDAPAATPLAIPKRHSCPPDCYQGLDFKRQCQGRYSSYLQTASSLALKERALRQRPSRIACAMQSHPVHARESSGERELI